MGKEQIYIFNKWFNYNYDRLMQPLERGFFFHIRRELLNKANGEVLEIGSGTGVNFHYYKNVRVTAIEPNEILRKRSYERARKADVPITILEGNAENLIFEDNSFDTVVGTLVLCTVPDPGKAVQEIVRVCRPNGTILFFEHVRFNNRFLGALQDLLTPIWRKTFDGCHLNRNTVDLLREEGLDILELKRYFRNSFITVEARNKKR